MIEDGKVTITAHLPATSAGQSVYFRLVTPDPDDLSPYERDAAGNLDTLPGDNISPGLATPDRMGKLDGQLIPVSKTAELKTINNRQVAAAEVELSYNDISGNNYQVEASLDATFVTGVERTAVLVAWKRIYLEIDRMYKKGATITADFAPDADADNDVLTVDNAADFVLDNPATPNADESSVVLFKPDGSTLNRQVLAVAGNTITVADLETAFPKYCGVKLANNADTYDVSLSAVEGAFGGATDGSDGGVFVEVKSDVIASGFVPKYTLFPDGFEPFLFSKKWFDNSANKQNLFQLVATNQEAASNTGFVAGGRADTDANIIALYSGGYGPTARTAEAVAHEIGHQMNLLPFVIAHVDQPIPDQANQNIRVRNHDDTDWCLMTYSNDQDNGYAEFDKQTSPNCIDTVRNLADPVN